MRKSWKPGAENSVIHMVCTYTLRQAPGCGCLKEKKETKPNLKLNKERDERLSYVGNHSLELISFVCCAQACHPITYGESLHRLTWAPHRKKPSYFHVHLILIVQGKLQGTNGAPSSICGFYCRRESVGQEI